MWTELPNLKESNEFLNLLLDNINSAVLIADENLQIHQFKDDFLGKSRFYDALKKHRHESIQQTMAAVYADVNEFRYQATPDDDISILGVEYCGQA